MILSPCSPKPPAYLPGFTEDLLHTDVGPAALAQALSVASRHHAYDIESVRAILAMDGEAPAQGSLPEALLQRWPDASVRAVDSAAYGWLTEVAAGGEAP